MSSRTGGCPPSSLPSRHTHQLSRLIDLYHAIDFTVGMEVVLPAIFFLAIHVNGSDAEIASRFGRCQYSRAAVFLTVNLVRGDPAFVARQAFSYKGAKVFVVGVPGAIFTIQ